MKLYIHSTAAISPLDTYRTGDLPGTPPEVEGKYFTCMHPDYKQLISPAALRRMSPVIRMGLASALSCLEQGGTALPGAIVVGSGLGCVKDTVKFLDQVVGQDEQLLNPTAFIQSTHNTVSGQIALTLGCRAYNLTFTQKSFSFESALMDALLLSAEDPGRMILLGGVDEITPESHRLMVQAGCVKDHPGGDILHSGTPGAVAGEGAAFFLVSGTPGPGAACIGDMEIVRRPDGRNWQEAVTGFLERNGCMPSEVGLVVSGRSGDERLDGWYREMEDLFPASTIASYKHLVGDFDTAPALGLHLAVRMGQSRQVPGMFLCREGSGERGPGVLLFNGTAGQGLSLILLSESPGA